jgi:CheY-like chemotaxis protein
MFDDSESHLGEMPARPSVSRFEGTGDNFEMETPRDTILVVEDDPGIRNLVRRFLGNLLPEFKAVLAEDPVQAIEFLRQGLSRQVAMIWTDNTMPNMLGREFVQVLKGATIGGHSLPKEVVRDLENVPVMMATGDGPALTADLLERGLINDVLPKPFTLNSARGVVVPIARGHQAIA